MASIEAELQQKRAVLNEANSNLRNSFVAYESSEKSRSSIKKQMLYTLTGYLSLSVLGYFTWATGSHLEKLKDSFITLGAIYLIFFIIQLFNYTKNSEENLSRRIDNDKKTQNNLQKDIKKLETEIQQLKNELNTFTR